MFLFPSKRSRAADGMVVNERWHYLQGTVVVYMQFTVKIKRSFRFRFQYILFANSFLLAMLSYDVLLTY